MSLSEDSPPFANLQKNAESFKNVFTDDVSSIIEALDSKISALVCDPDSLGSSLDSRRKSNAHVEFSMAKLNVMSHMKNLVEDAHERWTESLESLRNQFLDNVQEFLSNTKLEVKLPSPVISPKLGKKKSPAKSSPQISSLYPKIFETAKSIPGLSALLPKNNAEIKVEETSDEDEEPPQEPVKRGRIPHFVYVEEPAKRGRSPRFTQKKNNGAIPEVLAAPVTTPRQKGRTSRDSVLKFASSPFSNATNLDEEEEMEQEEAVPTPVQRGRRSTARQVNTPASAKQEEPAKRGRTPRKTPKKNNAAIPEVLEEEEDVMEVTEETFASNKNTPKPKHFSLGLDMNDDLDIYSPDVTISRSAPRRKTVVVPELTPEVSRAKSKRKTLAGSQLDTSVAPSPKRFKSGRKSMAATPSNLLEEEDDGGPWLPLSSVSPSVAAQPAVYELKVATAKKPAFIGACEDLQDKMVRHKITASTGKKNLDKFVERNLANLQVRYQLFSDVKEAKKEEFERVKKFMAMYHTTPAQN